MFEMQAGNSEIHTGNSVLFWKYTELIFQIDNFGTNSSGGVEEFYLAVKTQVTRLQ